MTDKDKMNVIIAVVCKDSGMNFYQLANKCRNRELVYGRNLIFYFLKKDTKMSLLEIGKIFGKDHASVIHGIRTVENLVRFNGYSETTVRIRAEIKAGFCNFEMRSYKEDLEKWSASMAQL